MKRAMQRSSLPEDMAIEPRRPEFQAVKGKPRYWHPVAVFTHLLTAASLFFPEGERFFVRSVQNYARGIEDPQLRKDIAGFMQQEIIHGEMHERYNYDIADQQGYPYLRGLERILVKGTFANVRRFTSKQVQLALTVCLEHVTATLAGGLLKYPQLMEDANPEHREIWFWHAVEESEHKAVAYDVYLAIGGSYWIRVSTMVVSNLMFLSMVLYVTGRMLHTDGLLFDGRTWHQARVYARKRRPIFKTIGKEFIQFFRRDFHPWQIDNRQDIAAWKQRYALTGRAA